MTIPGIDKEDDMVNLQELSDRLTDSDIRELMLMKNSEHLIDIQRVIEDQAYSQNDILSRYTSTQYVQQDIEVGGLALSLRTIPPFVEDQCIKYAMANNGGNKAIYDRTLARRRVSYGLLSVNGNFINGMPMEGSYFSMASGGKDAFMKALDERANQVMLYLEMSGLAGRIIDIYMVWELVVYNRLNGIEDMRERLKKSTPTSTSAQSVG